MRYADLPRAGPIFLLALLLAACGPALDWREMQPPGAHLRLAMPCRPASHQREVPLAGVTVAMTLFACQVEGGTYALSHADLGDPGRVGPALEALLAAAERNVQGHDRELEPAVVPGMTPQALARRWRLAGRLPDGRTVMSQGVVFAHGTRVYQATIVGERIEAEAARHFFEALAIR